MTEPGRGLASVSRLADIPATARPWRQRRTEFGLSIAAFLGVALQRATGRTTLA